MRDRRGSRSRERGDLDATDVVVGVALMIVVPIVFAFLLSIVGLPLSRAPEVVQRKKPRYEVPFTDTELREIHQVAAKILDENAKHFVGKWRGESDDVAKIYESRLARRCLDRSRAQFDEFLKRSGEGSFPALETLRNDAAQRIAEIDSLTAEPTKDDPFAR